MATDKKTMRRFLTAAQKLQRQAMLKGRADVSIETRHLGNRMSLEVDAYLRTEQGELMKDENSELVCKCVSLYYYYDEKQNQESFDAVCDFLTNHKAI